MKPFVKWAGGKRQIIAKISKLVLDSTSETGDEYFEKCNYIEPFLGGGAVFFELHPKCAIINDLNSDLINAYKVIASEQVYDLIDELKRLKNRYFAEDKDDLYYSIRMQDREKGWAELSSVKKAARMIFLNKTCYNGLYRVNSKGQFNTPIGRYKNPLICDEDNILEIHEYLNENCIQIMNSSYEKCISKAKAGDVIYVDPPYDYEDDDGFTKYQMSGFEFKDFVNLKKCCDKAMNRGAYVIISNNATEKVLNLFKEDANYKIYAYDTNKFQTLRSINCKGTNRKNGYEVIFWGIPNLVPLPQANDIDKVIKLCWVDELIYLDKTKVAELINVSTERQAAYYLAALKFFGYLNNLQEVTEDLKQLKKQGEKTLILDMKNKILENDFVKEIFEKNAKTTDEIGQIIQNKYNKKISSATSIRRASTLKNWIEWALKQ